MIRAERPQIALYMRASHRSEADDSIVNQKKLLYHYVAMQKELSGCPVWEGIDQGYTGINFNRPAFQEMLCLAQQNKIHCIIVKDLSRLGRNYVEINDYLNIFIGALGLRLIALNDGFDSSHSPLDEENTAIVNLIYELYSRELSIKVRRVIAQKQKQGEYKVSCPFYGYQYMDQSRAQLVENKETADVVRKIFTLYEQGKSKADIAYDLNKDAILTPNEYAIIKFGKKSNRKSSGIWTAGIVSRILLDERYTGTMIRHQYEADGMRGKLKRVPREAWFKVENMHQPLIERERFAAIHRFHKRRCPIVKKQISLVRCGYCGHVLVKQRSKGEYLCRYARYQIHGECHRAVFSILSYEEVLRITLQILLGQIDKTKLVSSILSARNSRLTEQRSQIAAEVCRLKRAKRMLYEQLADDCILKENYWLQKKEYDARIEQKQCLIRRKEELTNAREKLLEKLLFDTRAGISVLLESFFTKILINKVKIYTNQRIELYLNCRNEEKVLP